MQLGRRESHTEFPTELTRLHIAWHVPDAAHPDIPALDVLAVVLGGGRSSRLYRRLRDELALVHSIDAWCYAPGQAGLWGIDAMLDPEKRLLLEGELHGILQEVREKGVTSAELEKAKKLSLSHQIQGVIEVLRLHYRSSWHICQSPKREGEMLNQHLYLPDNLIVIVNT